MAYGIESYDQSGSELVGMTLLPASREGVNYPTWSMYMHVPYPKKCFYFNMLNHHLSSDQETVCRFDSSSANCCCKLHTSLS